MTDTPVIQTIQVGLPQVFGTEGAAEAMDRPWTSAFEKSVIEGPVYLGTTNLAGDAQADLVHHGGADKAVCVYSYENYRTWETRLARSIPPGGFGENFTVANQDEQSVCIGDVFRVGDAVVEVSQPRSPCWKLARRWRVKELSLWFQQTGLTGWYLRVLQPGYVESGAGLFLEARPYPALTVMRANELCYAADVELESLAKLVACEALGASWRTKLARRLDRGEKTDDSPRLIGTNDD